MMLHTGEKGYCCREGCSKTFGGRSSRVYHEKSHKGVKEYKCKSCPEKFPARSSRLYHERRQHGGTKNKCKTCPEMFGSRFSRFYHEKRHHGGTEYMCYICQEKFFNRKSLVIHEAKVHGNVSNVSPDNFIKPTYYPFQCNICSRGVSTEKSLEEHTSTHIKNIPCQVPGEYCNDMFYKENEMFTHMLSVHNYNWQHGQKLLFKCDQCDYIRTKKEIATHMKKHSRVKTFICPECGKLLKSKSTLECHIKKHAQP